MYCVVLTALLTTSIPGIHVRIPERLVLPPVIVLCAAAAAVVSVIILSAERLQVRINAPPHNLGLETARLNVSHLYAVSRGSPLRSLSLLLEVRYR